VKRADFIRYWRRSGLKNPDKPKIFLTKNVRTHSYCTTNFIRFWRRPGLTESGWIEVYCIYSICYFGSLIRFAHYMSMAGEELPSYHPLTVRYCNIVLRWLPNGPNCKMYWVVGGSYNEVIISYAQYWLTKR